MVAKRNNITATLIPFDPMLTGKRQRRQAAALVVQSLWSSNSKKKQPTATATTDATSATPATSNASAVGSTSLPESSTTNNNNNNNTATATRPVLEVPPMAFGPIRDPNQNDVLCGRGGLINSSPGNVQFREIVSGQKAKYNAKSTKRHEKAHLAAEIVRHIRSMNPPGRFLREDVNGLWFDIGDAKAIRKTGQALREAAPSIRQELEQQQQQQGDGADGSNGYENNSKKDEERVDTCGEETSESPKEKSKGSPKRNKETTKKEPKAKKATPKEKSPSPTNERDSPTHQDGPNDVINNNDNNNSPVRNTTRDSAFVSRRGGKRTWMNPASLLGVGGGNGARTAAAAVEPQQHPHHHNNGYMLSQTAMGPHVAMAVAQHGMTAMPRMSQGAVFSNTATPRSSSMPTEYPHLQQSHQVAYQQHHHMYSSYPYPPHMNPYAMYPSQAPYDLQHQHMPPPPPPPSNMMFPSKSTPYFQHRDSSTTDAFGLSFFPTSDPNTEQQSEGCSSTLMSDISGLSSCLTPPHPAAGQRKQMVDPAINTAPSKNKGSAMQTPPVMSEFDGVPPMLGPTTMGQSHRHHYGSSDVASISTNSQAATRMMLDTTSSLLDINGSDVDMLSSTCGGAVSSLAMASVVSSAENFKDTNHNSSSEHLMQQPRTRHRESAAAPPPRPESISSNSNSNSSSGGITAKASPSSNSALQQQQLKPSSTARFAMMKLGDQQNQQQQQQQQQPFKEASTSTSSCVSGSGKSEISLPSSCGTNISTFSDSFMAMQLSDHHEFD